MFCNQCKRLLKRINGQMICLSCQTTNKINESIYAGIPRFITPKLIITCYFKKPNITSPSWLTNSSSSYKSHYLNLINNLMQQQNEETQTNTEIKDITCSTLSILKRMIYKEKAKEHFDPRTEGNYTHLFIDAEEKSKNLLILISNRWGNLQCCSKCQIYSDKNFVLRIDDNTVCYPCSSGGINYNELIL